VGAGGGGQGWIAFRFDACDVQAKQAGARWAACSIARMVILEDGMEDLGVPARHAQMNLQLWNVLRVQPVQS
jgi:hypothetical protein